MNKNIKKIIAAGLVSASFSCMAVLEVFAAPKYVNITGEPVAVREEPGTSSKYVNQVHYGDQLVYFGEKNDKKGVRWYQIKLSDGKKGWVTSAYAETVDENDIGRVQVTTKLLNIRAKASLTSDVLGITRIGSQFDYFSVKKDSSDQTWYRVHYGEDNQAWLLGTYCKVIKEPGKSDTKTDTKSDTKSDGKMVEITSSPVNVRSKASMTGNKIGSATKGKKYEYLASDTDEKGRLWYKISYTSGKSGWVLSSLSKLVNDGGTTETSTTSTTTAKTTTKTTVKATGKQVEITANALRVRDKASRKGKILATVKNGKKFKYISSKKDSEGKTWYQIEYKSGKKGWIHSDYAKLTGQTTTATTAATKKTEKKVSITGSKVVVRGSASKKGKNLGTVKKGKTFKYLSTKKDAKGKTWYQIQYTSKKKGWVLGSLSKLVTVKTKATTKATTVTTKTSSKQIEIIESPVRVRESASTSSKRIGSTSEGKKYKYLATKKDEKGRIWYQIQYKTDEKGWVLGTFCKLV